MDERYGTFRPLPFNSYTKEYNDMKCKILSLIFGLKIFEINIYCYKAIIQEYHQKIVYLAV